jgi:chloramphenicol O-acetyltransferase type B
MEIRKRFNEDQIAMLPDIKWWDWELERLKPAMPLLCSGNVDELYRYSLQSAG